MKRLFSVLLVIALMLTLCACDKVEKLISAFQRNDPETQEVIGEEPAQSEDQEENEQKKPGYTTIVGDDPLHPYGYPPQPQTPQPQPQPTPEPEPKPEPQPEPEKHTKPDKIEVTDAQLQQIEDEFLELVNAERARLGLNALTPNETLDGFAQIRAGEILTVFSHTRPNGEKWDTVINTDAYPYVTAGENLVMTSHVGDQAYYPDKDFWTGSPEQISAAAGWIYKLFRESPAHYDNIKNEAFQESGIGITYAMDDTGSIPIFYLTHLFGVQQS